MPGFVDKISKMWNPPDDDYEENYDYEDEDFEDEEEEEEEERVSSSSRSSAPSFFHRSSSASSVSSNVSSSSNNVVNFSRSSSQLQVVVFKPTTYTDDAKAIADAILANCAVVINLERASADDYLKILLFINGVSYAKNAEIKMIATKTYIITPHSVELSGDVLLDGLEQSGVSF